MTDMNAINEFAELAERAAPDNTSLRIALKSLHERVATLESREASLPGAIGHMIRLHLEGSVDLEAMKPIADPKPTALQLAIRFHETYERLAPSFGYETRTDTRQFDPESKNGKLMVAVCGELAGLIPASPQVAGGDTDLAAAVERVRHIVGLSPDDQDPFGADVIAVCDAVKRLQEDERKTIACWERQAATIKQMQLELDSAREAERGAKEALEEVHRTHAAEFAYRCGDLQRDLEVARNAHAALMAATTPREEELRALRAELEKLKAPTPAAPCANAELVKELRERATYLRGTMSADVVDDADLHDRAARALSLPAAPSEAKP